MILKKVLCLTAFIGLSFCIVPIDSYANESNLLSGVNLEYSKISNVLGNISVNSKATGQLIQLPNGNYVRTTKNTDNNDLPYSTNYQISKPRNYSFIVKGTDNNNFVETVNADDLTLNATVTGDNKVTLKLNSQDTTSDVTEMRFSNDGTKWSDFSPYSNTATWTVDNVDGMHTIYVQFKDKAGNLSKPSMALVYLDKTAPKISFDINKGSSTTNSKTLDLNLSINDVSNIKTIYVSEDGANWKTYDGNLRTLKYDIIGNVGTKKIYIKAEDICGNISEPVSKDVLFDNELPTGSISINNGDNSTTTNKVTVHANFGDKLSGVKSVVIKEGTKSISLSKNDIEKGSIELPWTLNYGTSTRLDLEITDNAGNISKISSNTMKVVINNLELSSFNLTNILNPKFEDKFKSLTWSFPSQSMFAGGKIKFKLEYIKPNVVDNVSVDGTYTITILGDNGYSKVETLNLNKENNVDSTFIGEYTIPSDVPNNSKVYISSTIKADLTKDGKTTKQEVYFPLKNSQAEIGHIVGNIKNNVKFNQIK